MANLNDYINKFITRMKYEYCYTNKENMGIAIFGMCSGCDDSNCRYHQAEVQDDADSN